MPNLPPLKTFSPMRDDETNVEYVVRRAGLELLAYMKAEEAPAYEIIVSGDLPETGARVVLTLMLDIVPAPPKVLERV